MDERKRDQNRADRALDALGALVDSGDPELILAACKAMPALLERKAAMLGYDAKAGAADEPVVPPVVARILAAVPK